MKWWWWSGFIPQSVKNKAEHTYRRTEENKSILARVGGQWAGLVPADGDRGPRHRRRLRAPVEQALGGRPTPAAGILAHPLGLAHERVVLLAGVQGPGAVCRSPVDKTHVAILNRGQAAAVHV